MKQKDKRKEPVLIIDVLEVASQSSTIRLIRPGYHDRTVETSWGHGNLAEYYERYSEGLENFKLALQSDSLDQDFGALTNAFRALFTTGKILFARLFDSETPEIINYLRNCMVVASGSRRLTHPQAGVIEIRTASIKDIIPIDCLVIIGSKPEVKALSDVVRAASGVLGFSFIINRVIKRTRQSQKRRLNNVPRLPLKYFRDKQLAGTAAELDFFENNEKYFCLDGPWPEEFTKSIEKDLVRYLFRPDIGFGGIDTTGLGDGRLDEIHHLSCHGYTDEECSWKCSLQLTGSQPITLETMEAHLVDLRYTGAKLQTHVEMPLVFFNACGTSRVTPKGSTSFPEYFLIRNGNCGFIGSETRVPDLFASKFCQQFYLYLLRGCGVGEAIFEARHTMLRRYNNPLGILYTSYVDPYLQVTRAVDI